VALNFNLHRWLNRKLSKYIYGTFSNLGILDAKNFSDLKGMNASPTYIGSGNPGVGLDFFFATASARNRVNARCDGVSRVEILDLKDLSHLRESKTFPI